MLEVEPGYEDDFLRLRRWLAASDELARVIDATEPDAEEIDGGSARERPFPEDAALRLAALRIAFNVLASGRRPVQLEDVLFCASRLERWVTRPASRPGA